ncbi:MAG: hypothetical protein H6Q36_692 [Chloroflexi bacterium]|nr:hypothetical protein [Chloroflexota bacterium]
MSIDHPPRPAAFCAGPGHVVVHGNQDFRSAFGPGCVGIPAREGLLDLPAEAFDLLDLVLAQGRPLARWITRDGGEWRITAAPRLDPETGEVYGVAFHLRARSDVPVVSDSGAKP